MDTPIGTADEELELLPSFYNEGRQEMHMARYSEPLMCELVLLERFRDLISRGLSKYLGVEYWLGVDLERARRLIEHLITFDSDWARKLIMECVWCGKDRLIAQSPIGSIYRSLEDREIVQQFLDNYRGSISALDYGGLPISLVRYFSERGAFSLSNWAQMLMITIDRPDLDRIDQIRAIAQSRLPGPDAHRAISKKICQDLLAQREGKVDVQALAQVITLSPAELFSFCFQAKSHFREGNEFYYRTQLLQLALSSITELTWNNCQAIMNPHRCHGYRDSPKLFECIPKDLIQQAELYCYPRSLGTSALVYASPVPLFFDPWFAFRVSGVYYYLTPDLWLQCDQTPQLEGETPSGRIGGSWWLNTNLTYASDPEWISYGSQFQEQRCVFLPQTLADFIAISGQKISKSARSGDVL